MHHDGFEFTTELEKLVASGDELAGLILYARRLGVNDRDASRLIARIVHHDRATTDRATLDQARADARLLAQREAHAGRLQIEDMRIRARAISDDVSLIASGFMLHPETRILFAPPAPEAVQAPEARRARRFYAVAAVVLWCIALHGVAADLGLVPILERLTR
jgi:hypothetical protein